MAEPRLPVNVRIQYADGEVIPLELTFKGYDDEGCRVWIAVDTSASLTDGARILADSMPPKTAIMVPASLCVFSADGWCRTHSTKESGPVYCPRR